LFSTTRRLLTNSQTLHELALGLRERNTACWRALYQEFAPIVWRRVARLVGESRGEVADIVQEVFLAAVQSTESFDPSKGNLWQWLWGIAHNKVAMHFRRQKKGAIEFSRLESTDTDQLFDWLDERMDEPPDILANAELVAAVRAVLVELSPHHADVLLAKYMSGSSVNEIAEQEGTTVDAISSRLARARQAFRERFEAEVSSPDRSQVRNES
jgi:RNA polymerase sigma-70 factor (ECF subfamily)